MAKVRVLRILEYVGEREWVEATITKSVHGERRLDRGTIRAATLGLYPELLDTPVLMVDGNLYGENFD